eukprot:Rmarinus@m.28342
MSEDKAGEDRVEQISIPSDDEQSIHESVHERDKLEEDTSRVPRRLTFGTVRSRGSQPLMYEDEVRYEKPPNRNITWKCVREFSGAVSEDVEEWIQHFERQARFILKLDREEDRLACIVQRLRGDAAHFVDTCPEIVLESSVSLLQGLREQYKTTATKEFARVQLGELRQGDSEKVEAYLQRLRRLCLRVNPRMEDEEKSGFFLQGLRRDLQRYCLERVRDGQSYAQLVATSMKGEEQMTRLDDTASLRRAITELQQKVNGMSRTTAGNHNTPNNNDVPTGKAKRRWIPQWTPEGLPICANCKKPGHKFYECQEPRRENRVESNKVSVNTVNSSLYPSSVMQVRLHLGNSNDDTVTALVDTGAAVSLVKETLLKKLPPRPWSNPEKSLEIIDANGKEIPCEGQVTLNILDTGRR